MTLTRCRNIPCRNRRGIALILALGVLAVFMVMVVAFASMLRTHRRSSRSFADEARARQLLHAVVVRAVTAAGEETEGFTYPLWPEGDGEVLSSTGGTVDASNLLRCAASSNVTSRIPGALRDALSTASPRWIDVNAPTPGGALVGRVAFIVLNASGLVDVNELNATNTPPLREVVERLPEVDDVVALATDLNGWGRFESVAEIDRLAAGLGQPTSNLFVLSFDPAPDVYFTNALDLGFADIALTNRLDVNDGAAGAPTAWRARLDSLLTEAFGGDSPRARAVAWNLVNFLDADRIPRNDGATPWLDDSGGEAVPLIDELVLREVEGGASNRYEVAVELWFPFYPATVAAADNFTLQVGVFSNDVPAATALAQMAQSPPPDWCFSAPVGAMRFGDATERLVFTSPEAKRIAFPEVSGDPPETNYRPLSAARPVWVLARVVHGGAQPVDQAPGPDPLGLTAPIALSVADPRANGSTGLWLVQPSNTLGALGAGFDAAQELPFLHRDGPMESIAEIGFVYASPQSTGVTNDAGRRTVDLFDPLGGATLPDWMTVRGATNRMNGLIGLGTSHRPVLEALFTDRAIGWTNSASSTSRVITVSEVAAIADVLLAERPYLTFMDALLAMESAASFDRTVGTHALRGTLERLTLRQNVFIVIVGAQILSPSLATRAEKYGMAVVLRDAFTGETRIRDLMEPVLSTD